MVRSSRLAGHLPAREHSLPRTRGIAESRGLLRGELIRAGRLHQPERGGKTEGELNPLEERNPAAEVNAGHANAKPAHLRSACLLIGLEMTVIVLFDSLSSA